MDSTGRILAVGVGEGRQHICACAVPMLAVGQTGCTSWAPCHRPPQNPSGKGKEWLICEILINPGGLQQSIVCTSSHRVWDRMESITPSSEIPSNHAGVPLAVVQILLRVPVGSLRGFLWGTSHVYADCCPVFLLIDHSDVYWVSGWTGTLMELRNHLEMSALGALLNM